MNKIELVDAISNKTYLTKKDSKIALEAFIDVVTETLAEGDDVKLVGFGTFKSKEMAARVGHNPQTGEELQIPAHKKVSFKASSTLKDSVN